MRPVVSPCRALSVDRLILRLRDLSRGFPARVFPFMPTSETALGSPVSSHVLPHEAQSLNRSRARRCCRWVRHYHIAKRELRRALAVRTNAPNSVPACKKAQQRTILVNNECCGCALIAYDLADVFDRGRRCYFRQLGPTNEIR